MGSWRSRESVWLPDQKYWLEDPFAPENRIESAVDERGIVVPDATNSRVLSMLDPSYRGLRDTTLNHYVFPETDFKGRFIGNLSLVKYRNLVSLTRLLPVDIHNFFTVVVEPAPMAEPEVMSYAIEAWRVAHNLFQKAAKIKEAERQIEVRASNVREFPFLRSRHDGDDSINNAYLIDRYNHQFTRFDNFLGDYENLPREFKPAQIDVDMEPQQLVHSIVSALGNIVMPQTVRPPALPQAA